MRAVLIEEFGVEPSVQEVPDPQCPPDGVVVEVAATGLCRSDWHAWRGHDPGVRLPLVPGHELAGTITAVGPRAAGWRVGDRVTTPFVLACGECRTCRRGDGQVCEDQEQPGFTRWGSYAELVAIPRAGTNLIRLPDEVTDDVAAILGCRFATAYRAVAQVADVRAGESVVVHGCGGVGLSAVLVALARGAQVYAVDPAAASRQLAEELGATPVDPGDPTDPDHPPHLSALAELTGGGAAVSLDALGSAATMAASVACLRPRGRHVQVGLLAGTEAAAALDLGQVIARELQVLGSHGMAAADYPEMLALIADGTLRPDRLIRTRIGLAEAGARLAGLSAIGSGAGGMTVIHPGG